MGVDYSSSMLNIQDNHAYDIKNFLKENGTLQKRKPYEQVGIGGLNGIWECHYLGQRYIVAHKGNNLYLVNDIDKYDRLANNYMLIGGTATIKDQKSWGVFANDRLYILCGNYIVVKFGEDGVLTHSNVYEDVDTYIPTTTIGITHTGSTIGVNRETLDAPNMMTNWRYNEVLTTLAEGETYNDYNSALSFLTYELDSQGIDIYNNLPSLTLLYVDNNGIERNLNIVGQYNSQYSRIDFKTYGSQLGAITIDGQPLQSSQASTEFTIAYVTQNGILSVKIPLKPIIKENPTIKIKFYVESEDYELINNCTFGIMYGAGGNRNRLFLSGNPNQPNVDYHSSRRNIYAVDSDVDLEDSQDLTYFSVYDYCAYGTSNSAVTDYQIMGDGSLMVLKEESPNEANIYFRDAKYETKTIYVGSEAQYLSDEVYPMRVGNIGEGAIKGVKGTLKNLNNDLVFVSDNGVFGISSTVSASMLASDYKYSYGRSRLINERLKKQLLNANNVATIVYDHKYFITIKDNSGEYTTYVGDGRYAYKLKDSIDNEYEYEWFVLKGINANQYHLINGNLYYSNDNGLFKFDIHKKYEKYIDMDKINVGIGNLTYTSDDNISYQNGTYVSYGLPLERIKNANKNYIVFDGDSNDDGSEDSFICVRLGMVTTTNKVLDASNLSEQAKTYLKTSNNYEIGYYDYASHAFIPVTFSEIDDEENKFLCSTEFLSSTSIYVKCNQNKYEVVVEEESPNNYRIKAMLDSNGYACEFYSIKNASTNPYFAMTGIIYLENIVDCYYLTKAFNFGQSVYNKHLRSLTIVNDSEMLSYTDFGIITKDVKKRFENNYFSGTQGIDDIFSNIFRADLTNGSFASSFTKDYILRFNFVQFEFFNENETNCIINNLSVLYTIGFKQKGVS